MHIIKIGCIKIGQGNKLVAKFARQNYKPSIFVHHNSGWNKWNVPINKKCCTSGRRFKVREQLS